MAHKEYLKLAVFQAATKEAKKEMTEFKTAFALFQAATREVEKDFQSVYSRLVLCKTYRSVLHCCYSEYEQYNLLLYSKLITLSEIGHGRSRNRKRDLT